MCQGQAEVGWDLMKEKKSDRKTQSCNTYMYSYFL